MLSNTNPGLADGTDYRLTPLKNLQVTKDLSHDSYTLYRDVGIENIENINLGSSKTNSVFACLCESINRIGD